MSSKYRKVLGWCCVLSWLAACGGDDEDTVPSVTGGSDNGGQEPAGGGSEASGGTTAASGGTQDDGSQPAPGCDPDIPADATCGGVTCEVEASLRNAPLCTVPCCIDVNGSEECGSRSASLDSATACEGMAVLDDSCPSYEDDDDFGGDEGPMPGCCTPEGLCGVWVDFMNDCLTEAPMIFVDLPDDPQPCGPNAGDGDGGDDGASDAAVGDGGVDAGSEG